MISKRLIIISLIFSSTLAFGQNAVEVLFKQADVFYHDENLDSALNAYKVIVEKYPNDPAYPRAFYNIGYISWKLNRKDDALKVFLKILDSNFDDKEKGPGEGIMSEPYAIYKHRASSILSEIYLDSNDFINGLKYLELSDKKYPYQTNCGNGYAENDINTAVSYSKCYDGLNQIDKAINVLWNHIFNYGLAENEQVIAQMKVVLPKKYTLQQIEIELRNAEKTISVKLKKANEIGYIKIFRNKIRLPASFAWKIEDSRQFDEFLNLEHIEKYKKIYTNSDFYREFAKNASH